MSTNTIAILHYAGPPTIGGVESTIAHHARLLVERGYRVRVIAGNLQPFDPRISTHEIPEISSRHPRVLALGSELARGSVPPEFEGMRDLLATRIGELLEDADVCIAHNIATLHKNLALSSALRKLADGDRVRLIAWCHDFAWQDELYQPNLHAGEPWDLLRTRWPGVRYVVVSTGRQERLADLLGMPAEEIAVVPPGVDLARCAKLEPQTTELIERHNLLEAEPLVLLPARITRRKNIEFALRVTGHLRAIMPRTKLIVSGPPGPHNPTNSEYLAELNALRADLDLAAGALFLFESGPQGSPFVPADSVMADLFHIADVLLFPSRSEGFGIPVLEAGLARLPIFAADLPSVREAAGDLARRFDPGGDPEAVAAAMADFLQADPVFKMRRRTLAHYRWEAIAQDRLIPLIEELNR